MASVCTPCSFTSASSGPSRASPSSRCVRRSAAGRGDEPAGWPPCRGRPARAGGWARAMLGVGPARDIYDAHAALIGQVRDILRSSSVSLDARRPVLASDVRRGGEADATGGSAVAHDAARPARRAVGSGLGGGDGAGRRGDAENMNLHFSEGGAHEIPEWVLEPASGQVCTRLPRHSCGQRAGLRLYGWTRRARTRVYTHAHH